MLGSLDRSRSASMDSPKSASKSSDTLRLNGELPVKGSKPRPSGGGGSESKMAADLRLGETKMADVRLGESKMADLRLSESKMADLRLSESKSRELRLSESKSTELRLSESKMADLRLSESKMADLRLGEPKMADLRLSESKMADLRLSESKMADLRLGEPKIADLRLSESKMADLRLSESKSTELRLSESKMADSPDSSVLSSSRRSLLSLDGRGRGSFIKQENKGNKKKEEDEEDEKKVEERLGRLLGLVTSEPSVIRSCNYCTSFCAYNCTLKGRVSRDFLLLVFFMNQFPPSLRVSHYDRFKFFENSRRYSQVKVCHRYQRHRWQICHRCQ